MLTATTIYTATLFSGEKVRFERENTVEVNHQAISFIGTDLNVIFGMMRNGATLGLKDRMIFGGVSMLDFEGGFIDPAEKNPEGAVFIDERGNYSGPMTDETFTDADRAIAKGKRSVLFDLPVAMTEATYVVGTDIYGKPSVVAFADPRQAQEYAVFKGNTVREIKTYEEFASDATKADTIKKIPAWSKK